MIKINKNTFVVARHITHYKKSPMCESKYLYPSVNRELVRGGFWNALFHLDFSMKDVTYYCRTGFCSHLFCFGTWEDVVKYYTENPECRRIIDGKLYDMPYIKIWLSDGKEYTIFFDSNEKMRQMEKKIIRKINKKF